MLKKAHNKHGYGDGKGQGKGKGKGTSASTGGEGGMMGQAAPAGLEVQAGGGGSKAMQTQHWVKDAAVDACMNRSCQARFTSFERRHHCRNCGGVFCHRCSSNEAKIPALNITKKARVCDKCYATLRQAEQQSQ